MACLATMQSYITWARISSNRLQNLQVDFVLGFPSFVLKLPQRKAWCAILKAVSFSIIEKRFGRGFRRRIFIQDVDWVWVFTFGNGFGVGLASIQYMSLNFTFSQFWTDLLLCSVICNVWLHVWLRIGRLRKFCVYKAGFRFFNFLCRLYFA